MLPLEALLDNQLDNQKKQQQNPTAVVSQEKNILRILCCNNSAKQSGVEPELTLSTALTLCPTLVTLQQQSASEKSTLQRLALLAYNFSPTVIIAEQGLWLELSGCEQLFHGYNQLLQQLQQALLSRSISVDMGIAASADGARLLCRSGFQNRLPNSAELQLQLQATSIRKLAINKRQQQSFQQLGLDSLGDLLALPRAELARRFGTGIVDYLQLLLGEKPCRLQRFQPPASFHDLLQNPQGIFSKQGLLFPMKTLLQRFSLYLQARQCHCRTFEWRFEPLLGEPVSMRVTLSGSHNSWTNLLDLSRLQLDRISLPASIESIILTSDDFIEATPGELDLFDSVLSDNATIKKRGKEGKETESTETHRLIDSLRARLGPEALLQPALGPDYLPEKAGKIIAAGERPQPAIAHHGLQPLWLLPKPVSVQMRNQQLFWRQRLYILSGPQRLCDNWWQTDQQRDYYLACDAEGARYWLFRQPDGGWFVQGLFA